MKGKNLLTFFYEGELLKHRFDADFYIENKIIIEAKATTFIHADSFRQTLNYLKASQVVKLGIIVNFGTDKLEFKRIVLTGNNS
jgi:GxxExxY protein